MSRFYEEVQERRFDQHVAAELRISEEILGEHPFEVGESPPFVCRIYWQAGPPEGVKANGPIGHQWSDISPLYEDDGAA